jgi:hypothetical protein
MKTKFLFGTVFGFVTLLLIAATTTEVNIKDLPVATTLAVSDQVLVVTNGTKSRLAPFSLIRSSFGDTIWTNDNGNILSLQPDGTKYLILQSTNGVDSSKSMMIVDGNQGVVEVTSGEGSPYADGQLYAYKHGTNMVVALVMKTASTKWVVLDPEMDFGLNAPLILGSDVVRTSTEDLVEFQNHGTNVAKLKGDGALSLSSQTNKIADSGTAVTFNGSPLALQSAVDGKQATLTATTAVIGTNGVFGSTVNATNGFLKGALTGISVTNTFYSVTADLMATVTNVVVVSGGIVTSWQITQ